MKVRKSRIQADVLENSVVIHFLPTHLREMQDAQYVLEEIEEIVYPANVKLVVLNCARLKQMTSAFLSKMIILNKSLRQAGIALQVCCMAPQILHAFHICKLEKVIPYFETEAEALDR